MTSLDESICQKLKEILLKTAYLPPPPQKKKKKNW